MNPHLSIVSPVYKAEACLCELHRRIVAAAERITSSFEIILVEDHSPDGSWRVLEEMAAGDKRVKAVKLSRNFGQHYAITAGLEQAHGEWVIVMDCDLQDSPEEIETLYRKAQEGYDSVFARRINRKDSWGKKMRSRLFSGLLAWLTGEPFDHTLANFSISSRRAIKAFREYRERDRSYYLIIRDIGYPIGYVDVEHKPRFAGATSYTWGKLIHLAFQAVVSSSTRPLQLSIWFGTMVAGLSFLYMIFLIARYFFLDIGVPGWTTLAVMISFFFGLLFLQVGVMGLYLGKTFEESKQRPLYHVAEKLNDED